MSEYGESSYFRYYMVTGLLWMFTGKFVITILESLIHIEDGD